MWYSVHARRKGQPYHDRRGYKFSNIVDSMVASSSSFVTFGPVRPNRCNTESRSSVLYLNVLLFQINSESHPVS